MLRVRNIKLLNKKECSFELAQGEWLQITGSNGVGKSLLLKSLARLIPSEWSELSLNDKDTKDYAIEEWRSSLLYLPPEVVFDSEMTVDEFLDEPFGLHRYKNFQKTFDPKKYWKNLTTPMMSLSSGQKQQVALLRALSLNPKILLLDEPFGHMDTDARDLFLKLLANWSSVDKGVVLVSHISVDSGEYNFRKILF